MLTWFNFDVFSYEHQPLRRELQDPDVCRVHPGEAGKGEVWPDAQNLGRGRLGEVPLLLHYFCWFWLSQVHLCCFTLQISTSCSNRFCFSCMFFVYFWFFFLFVFFFVLGVWGNAASVPLRESRRPATLQLQMAGVTTRTRTAQAARRWKLMVCERSTLLQQCCNRQQVFFRESTR